MQTQFGREGGGWVEFTSKQPQHTLSGGVRGEGSTTNLIVGQTHSQHPAISKPTT